MKVPALAADIAAAFVRLKPDVRTVLMRTREVLFDVAADDPVIGELSETLKWGQPSYVPKRARVGTPVRLALTKSGDPAALVHCQTTLVTEAALTGLRVEGNRAVYLDGADADALRAFVRNAFLYHVRG